MKAIVVVDKNWGIGRNNGLLFRLPPDMARFKRLTTGNVVVMGGNTLRSFPGGRPLPDRTNIVLSSTIAEGDYITVRNLDALRQTLKKFDTDRVFVIGGASFYKTMLPYCRTVHVTKVDADGNAEVYFENLDRNSDFVMENMSDRACFEGLDYRFVDYKNINVREF